MKGSVQVRNQSLIIHVPKELDHHSALPIRRQADDIMMHQNIREVVMDFSGTDFMDSSGIGMIIGRYKLIKGLGGNVFLVCSGGRIEKLIALSGLTRLIPVYKTVDEALTNIKEG